MTTYETNGWMKFAEEDKWDTGCGGPTLYATGRDVFAASTVPELVEKLQEFLGSESENDVLLNSCEKDGRVDIQVLETDFGIVATKAEKDEWKRGERRLWACTYTFQVEKVTRETVLL